MVGLAIRYVDRPVATWSHAVLHRPAAALLITKLAGFTIFCSVAAFVLLASLVWRLAGRPITPAWRTAMQASFAILVAALSVILLKYAFGRLWPETWVRGEPNPSWIGMHRFAFLPFHGGEGYESFPSGHTARVTAPFAVLWHRAARFRLVWVLPAPIIAAALIAVNFHFVADCIAGAYVGAASAALAIMFL
jgi:membrane-associated phospholipid phosphatase